MIKRISHPVDCSIIWRIGSKCWLMYFRCDHWKHLRAYRATIHSDGFLFIEVGKVGLRFGADTFKP